MDFTKEYYTEIVNALRNVTTTFAIISEPDKCEDKVTQQIRERLRGYAETLFSLRSEIEEYLNPYKNMLKS